MTQYAVTGMSCAACSARVEKAVSAVPGVTSCAVSLLTNSMGVEGTASEKDIIAAVEKAGYSASKKDGSTEKNGTKEQDKTFDTGVKALRGRLVWSLVFLLILMYFSMGHMMWNWPVPEFMKDNHVAMGLLQLLLTTAVMVINQRFFKSGIQGLLHRAPNMDTLVALGAGAAYVYSTYALFAMTGTVLRGDMEGTMTYMHELYYESAAMILTLITVGKLLEAVSKGRTTDALKGLMNLAPKQALVVRNGEKVRIPVEQVKKGDVFEVLPGETVPVDGVILEGKSALDESALTGESIPVDKEPGAAVSAGTLNQQGFLRCEAVKVGEDTTLSQIIQMVSDAAATKAPIAKAADKVSGVFVPVVISIALVTIAVWLLTGAGVGYALARGISVLVISCPCALGLATPVAIMVGNGMGARKGILFKTAASLEETGRLTAVVLDKTGTVTEGKPAVTDVLPAGSYTEKELLYYAATLEQQSEHPLASAIMKYAQEQQILVGTIREFQALPGNGLSALLQKEDAPITLFGGKESFVGSRVKIPESIHRRAEALSKQGKTILFFAKEQELLGCIAVADVIKEESSEAIRQLHHMGLRVVMLTGDNRAAAEAIGAQAGVDEVIAEVLPGEKEEVIRKLQQQGKTAMVGDGINDAPALTRADVGIAIGAGTDIAIDAADVVLMKSRLTDVPAAIRLSRATLRNIHENLFWAFFYNALGIPLAAGVFIPLFHWQLNPMFAAAAMSLSSFCVVTNALRLNLFKMYDSQKDHKRIKSSGNTIKKVSIKENTEYQTQEVVAMKKTMKIDGMMCGHCEASVKKALEELPQVESAVVSHENGTAVVTLNAEVEDAVLKKAVEDKDYKVLSIES